MYVEVLKSKAEIGKARRELQRRELSFTSPWWKRLASKIGLSKALNPEITKMPYADAVRFEVSDFVHTRFESESFQAITAISVIEHGFNCELLLAEVSPLLRPEGYFGASFDYWPEKVDTTGITFFGMTWTIFSGLDVRHFLEEAKLYNLTPRGEINFSGGDRPIKCARKEYTFAWMVLQKS
jgi:hypothetical protein